MGHVGQIAARFEADDVCVRCYNPEQTFIKSPPSARSPTVLWIFSHSGFGAENRLKQFSSNLFEDFGRVLGVKGDEAELRSASDDFSGRVGCGFEPHLTQIFYSTSKSAEPLWKPFGSR
jgi:hypothetical protein